MAKIGRKRSTRPAAVEDWSANGPGPADSPEQQPDGARMSDSPGTAEGQPGSGRAGTAARRKKIQEDLDRQPDKKISFADLQKEWDVTDQALYQDAKYFQANGVPILVKNKHFVRGADSLKT